MRTINSIVDRIASDEDRFDQMSVKIDSLEQKNIEVGVSERFSERLYRLL